MTRKLEELRSVGPATMQDLGALGVHSVEALAKCEPADLYRRLCRLKGRRVDPCCLDVFSCAVAQARDPELPEPLRDWWAWSRIRKDAERGPK
ncbi:MAG: helix-hairpin-helix domain-containing protein [Acidobacteriota bacterium]